MSVLNKRITYLLTYLLTYLFRFLWSSLCKSECVGLLSAERTWRLVCKFQ